MGAIRVSMVAAQCGSDAYGTRCTPEIRVAAAGVISDGVTRSMAKRLVRGRRSQPRVLLREAFVFAALGVLVLAYTGYALVTGSVYAKDKWSGRVVARADEPGYYWTVVAIYAGLGIALLTVF